MNQTEYKVNFPSHKSLKGISPSDVSARKLVLCKYLADVAMLPQAIDAEIIEWFIGDSSRVSSYYRGLASVL